MILTDTHTHLYYETDSAKQDELIQRCLNNGISRLFLPNVNAASVALVMNMAARYPEYCFPMLGLHPCDVKAQPEKETGYYKDELEALRASLDQHTIYAIGEIGIDLYWDKTTLAIQQEAFHLQIQWAKERNLPVVIHCRDAFDEVYDVLQQEKDEKLKGIFHCFTGRTEQARKIIDLGLYLGIGGVVTYKNSGLDQVLAELNLDNIVLETDSPYLTPVPYRGKPNESSYLIHIAQKVADIFQLPLDQVAQVTTQNSKAIFGV